MTCEWDELYYLFSYWHMKLFNQLWCKKLLHKHYKYTETWTLLNEMYGVVTLVCFVYWQVTGDPLPPPVCGGGLAGGESGARLAGGRDLRDLQCTVYHRESQWRLVEKERRRQRQRERKLYTVFLCTCISCEEK